MRALAVLFLAVLASGCGRRGDYRSVPTFSAEGVRSWPSVSPPGSGLVCRMPGVARYDRRQGREDDGAFFRTISARTEVPFGAFGVIVTEWEGGLVGDPLEAAAEVADDLFSTQQLEQRRSQRLDMAGFYGREDSGVAENGVFVALRQFVGRARIYVVMAIVTNAPGPLSVAEAFMSSVNLDANDALLPVGRSPQELHALFLPETDFAVRMPPLSNRETSDLQLGERSAVAHSFVSELPQLRLRVRVIEVEGGLPPEEVEQVLERLALGQRGEPVQASGFPGLTFTRTAGDVAVRGRVFHTASRIYVLEAARPSSAAEAPSDAARTFFDSFRIL